MTNRKAVYNTLEQLRSDAYLQTLSRLSPEKQQMKHKLHEAFATMAALHEEGHFRQVESIAGHVLTVAPSNIEAYAVLGHIYLDLFDSPHKAVELFSEYVKKDKKNATVWAFLCIANFKLHLYENAASTGHEALMLDPGCISVISTLGQIAMARRDFDVALDYFREGLKYAPGDRALLTNFGGALQILGRKEDAEAFYRETLAKYPHFYNGYHALTKLSACHDENDPLFVQARSIADAQPENADDIEALYFALAAMYQQCKRYEEAWRYYAKAQALAGQNILCRPGAWDARRAHTVAFFSAQYFAQPQAKAKPHPSTQPVFIVGMPRSGTTMIEQILDNHSQVYAQGELHDLEIIVTQMQSLFGTKAGYPEALLAADEALLQRMADHYYDGLLAGVSPAHRFATDKMPMNFYWLGLAHRLFPGARFIHCMRNPMDMCLSIYTNRFAYNPDWACDLIRIANYYVNYRKLMGHWQAVLPMPTHTVVYEDMVADQRGETEKLLRFLGLEWEDACLRFHENKRSVSTASVWQVRQPIYTKSVEKWRRYEKELQPFIEGIGEYAK